MVISLLNAQKGRHTRQIFAQVPEKKTSRLLQVIVDLKQQRPVKNHENNSLMKGVS